MVMSSAKALKKENGGIRIVPFEEGDIEQIMAIEVKSFSAPWSRQSYLELAPLDSVRFFVVKKDNNVIGYMLYQMWFEEMELHTIAVSPDERRRGVSTMMLNHLLSDAKNRGIRRIFLQVRPSNEAAKGLYKKFGFETVGIRHRYYRDNFEDAYIMKLELKKDERHAGCS
jgi:ribosomal-protein-alanine N-acetyltransferase